MATVARVLSPKELLGERCVACAAAAETSIALEPAAGRPRPRAPAADRVRVCRGCAQAQADATKLDRKLVYAIVLIAPLSGIVAGVVHGHPGGVPTAIAVGLGLLLARFIVARLRRSRARAIPVLFLEADEDRVVVQIQARATSVDEPQAAYRAPAQPEPVADEEVAALPPDLRMGLPWFGGILASGTVLLAGFLGVFSRETTAVIDSPADVVRVDLDGEQFDLAAGGRAIRTVMSGEHQYEITYTESGYSVRGRFDAPLWKSVLLLTGPSQCYNVWVGYKGAEVNVHDNGPVRWAVLNDARLATRSDCRSAR